jgi:hypothetical protein
MSSRTKRQKTVRTELVSSTEDAENLLNYLRHSDPVLQIHLDANNDEMPDISLSTPNILENLLYPLPPSLFLSSCFRKKAVHIKSNNANRAKEISSKYMFDLDSRQIFEETSSDNVFLWIPSTSCTPSQSSSNSKDKKEGTTKAKALQSIEIQDPQTAHVLHISSNYASYCRAPPELEQPLVSLMLRDTGLGLGQYDPTGEKLTTLGRGEVETFIGTKKHLTDWHTDFQENFTIQLSGRKKWTLKQGVLKNPLRGTTPHYRSADDVIENQIKSARLSNPDFQFGQQDLESNAFGDEIEIIMDAGDVLYFPAGMWHKVETVEYGVSINVSLMGSTYASLVCRTLEHVLLEKEDWREVICSTKGNGSDAVEKLKALMNDLPGVVKEFVAAGGAEGILPPTLRRPPAFEILNDMDDMQNGGSDGDGDKAGAIDEDGEIEGEQEQDESDNESMSAMNESTEENEEDANIVDINEFEFPVDFRSTGPSGASWRRNQLGSLMKMIDVKSFFGNKDNLDECKHLFILNVNFAGNDMHESAVRTIFRDTSGLLESLCEPGKKIEKEIAKLDNPPAAIIYYGYIV